MLPDSVLEAISTSAELLASRPDLAKPVLTRWRARREGQPHRIPLTDEVREAADRLGSELSKLSPSAPGGGALAALFAGPTGEVLLAWCTACTWRRDAHMAELLAAAVAEPRLRERAVAAARARVLEGPLVDALACAPLLGGGAELGRPRRTPTARALALEILIWEAGASALEVPDLGRAWISGLRPEGAFEALILSRRTARSAAGSSPRGASR